MFVNILSMMCPSVIKIALVVLKIRCGILDITILLVCYRPDSSYLSYRLPG